MKKCIGLILALLFGAAMLIILYMEGALDPIIDKTDDFFGNDDDKSFNNSQNYTFIQCANNNTTSSTANNDYINCCNGLSQNCNKTVNEIMYATVHNAFSTEDDDFLAANHKYNIASGALEAGYRGFMIDLCSCADGTTMLCHSDCAFGKTDAYQFLTTIVSFLKSHKSELVILEVEVNDGSKLEDLFTIMEEVDGFVDRIYFQTSQPSWPMLGDLLSINKQIVLFTHRGPKCSEGKCPFGFYDTFDYISESSFEMTSVSQILEDTSCQIQSTGANARDFFLLNQYARDNFSLFASDTNAKQLNSYQEISNRVNTCSSANNNRPVNFIAVDFWSVGDVPKFVQEYNIALK